MATSPTVAAFVKAEASILIVPGVSPEARVTVIPEMVPSADTVPCTPESVNRSAVASCAALYVYSVSFVFDQ